MLAAASGLGGAAATAGAAGFSVAVIRASNPSPLLVYLIAGSAFGASIGSSQCSSKTCSKSALLALS